MDDESAACRFLLDLRAGPADRGGVVSPDALIGMRKAAALAFAIPGIEIDIACGNELIARVERRFEGANVALGTTLLSPCAFRAAVGRATAHARAGGRALFLGLESGIDLRLHYFMPFTGAATPLGMIVSRVGETIVHVFAADMACADARQIVGELALHPSQSVSGTDQIHVDVSWDPVAQISLVYCETRLASLSSVRPHVESLMHSVLVRTGVHEIVASVVASTARSAG